MKIYETKNEYGSKVTFKCNDTFTVVEIYINDVFWGTTKEEPFLKLLLRDIHNNNFVKKTLEDEINEVLKNTNVSNLLIDND